MFSEDAGRAGMTRDDSAISAKWRYGWVNA